MVPRTLPLRPVVEKWQCQKSGDCCRIPPEVLMHELERDEILRAITPEKAASLVWIPAGQQKRGFVLLQAGPCPLLSSDGLCSVYEVRPYNCRRFGCYRPDPSTEAFEPEPVPPFFCKNLNDRVKQSYRVEAQYRTTQRHAQREWAESHGWEK